MSSEKDIISKLKSKGFWEICIRPNSHTKDKLTLDVCKQIIEKCQVRLRGWSYPPIGNKTEQYFFGQNYVEGLINFHVYLEVWRFYQSGQFVHYQNFWEDSEKGIDWRIGFRTDYEKQKTLKVKGVTLTLYTIAEIFQLASNLINEKVYDDKIYISLKLHDVKGRSLATSEPLRILYKDYKCMIDAITFEKIYDHKGFDENLSNYIMEAVKDIFQRFGWISKDVEKALMPDLKDFLAGKIRM